MVVTECAGSKEGAEIIIGECTCGVVEADILITSFVGPIP
jgi:hypothetical protein